MYSTQKKTIGEMVANDYRTATVFEAFGIDFCCKGNRTIDEACESKGINKEPVLQEIEKMLTSEAKQVTEYSSWPMDILTDYIEKKHHRYIEEKTPILKKYLEKICSVHGQHHPELFQIKDLFFQSAGELAAHMKKEELILFPYIKKMVDAQKEQHPLQEAHFGTVLAPIQMMMEEHNSEGEIFQQIAKLSDNYNPPADACNTYKVTFALLKEFEEDLHFHIHLENNILFPKASDLENNIKIN